MKIFNLRHSSFININSASCCYDERRQSRTFWATYVCDLVFGADDSVLREFTELHVVIVCKGVSEVEKKTHRHHEDHSPHLRVSMQCIHRCVKLKVKREGVAVLLFDEDSIHAPQSRQRDAPGSRGEQQFPILRSTNGFFLTTAQKELRLQPLFISKLSITSAQAVASVPADQLSL